MNVKQIVSDHTQDKLEQILSKVRGNARPGLPLESGTVEFEEVSDLAHAIWYEVRDLDLDAVALVNHQDQDEAPAAHAINRAALAMRMARDLELQTRLIDLGIAGLICDIGMFTINPDILLQPRKLEPHENSIVQEHVARTLAGITAGRSWNAFVKTAVAHHHEREDGSGYPNSLTGSQLHPLGRILGVADVFCALIQDRPHRKRWPPHEALEYLVSAAGFEFNGEVVEVLYRMIPPYPVGTSIKLSTGESGTVLQVPGHLKHRPVVEISTGNDGEPNSRVIDLTEREHQNCIIIAAG